MRWIRRIHLYSGLFMFPWVLLYGVTGMFFNHPRWFNGDTTEAFYASEVADGELTQLTPPNQMVEKVVAEINAQQDAPKVTLTQERSPEYSRDFSFTVKSEDVTHSISIDPIDGNGIIRTSENTSSAKPEKKILEEISKLKIESTPFTVAQNTIPEILEELELPSGEATLGRLTSNLSFSAKVDGVDAIISYNMSNGNLTALKKGAESTMKTKSFLQRLHLSRGYSPHWGIKSLWGVLVDLMFLSMVFWGVSGLFMWWQIKRTRWLGGAFLIASVFLAGFLCIGMHENLTISASQRGSRSSKSPAKPKSESSTKPEKTPQRTPKPNSSTKNTSIIEPNLLQSPV